LFANSQQPTANSQQPIANNQKTNSQSTSVHLMKKIITVIGSSNIDMIMKMEHLPRMGETVTDAEYTQVYGGKGANQAVAAARAGGKVIFVNCVGDDVFAKPMVAGFVRDGMNTEFVFSEKGISSGTALIMVDNQGRNYLSVAPGANYRLTPEHVSTAEKAIGDSEIVIIQNEILAETNDCVVDIAYKLGKKVMYNFAPAKNVSLDLLSKIWMLVVNETEAEFLSGDKVESDEEIIMAAEKLLSRGPEIVIVTLGSRGSYIHAPGMKVFLPAFRVQAVDTTAAGDTYCGSLAVALAEGRDLSEAVKFAAAASAISVTRLGAQPSVPSRSEIDDFLKTHSDEKAK
jgi:ribokinase